MSAQPFIELSSGTEPPPLNIEPIPNFIISSSVLKNLLSSWVICPIFSSIVICDRIASTFLSISLSEQEKTKNNNVNIKILFLLKIITLQLINHFRTSKF